MIEIVINGERKAVGERSNLISVLTDGGFNCARIAVAVNSEFVARDSYATFVLNADDAVDIVTPVAGG